MSPELRRRTVVMSAFGDARTIVESMRLGAADFLSKPFEPESLQDAVAQVRVASLDASTAAPSRPRVSLADLNERLQRFARAPRSTVLLLGETGVGKSFLARRLHDMSERRDGPFVEINCAGIPPTLIESELMGHERGAFTSAHASKPGLFEKAHGGTLLLDEIGDMPLEMQAKLLYFIETRTFRRLGSTRDQRADVRIVAATHRDLAVLAKDGRFREDLYYRLKVLTITIPPLRERPCDMEDLVHTFLGSVAREMGIPMPAVSPRAVALLRCHDWPGNIRELRHVIEATLVHADGVATIEARHVGLALGRADAQGDGGEGQDEPVGSPVEAVSDAALPLHEFEAPPRPATVGAPPGGSGGAHLSIPLDGSVSLPDMEKEILRQAMRLTSGNQVRAAVLLGISRDVLRYRLKKYALGG
jgi:DNA-binding NtrC family response regulator